jgi:transposase
MQEVPMTPREERGLIIAALCKLNRQKNGVWMVPSQTDEKIYTVSLERNSCTCLDCTEGGFKCKHQFAVEFTIKREHGADGSVSETRSITFAEKKTYTQDWPAYNLAQTTEKHRFQELLFDLCRGVPQPPRPAGKTGRNPVLLSDAIFAGVFKVYSTVSTRRFSCDLKDAHERGYVTKPIHYNSVCAYLENKRLTPILHSLISRSALPLSAVETDFAVDSSGFSSSKFDRWYDEKYGVTRSRHTWIKTHLACGVKTNIVTAVRILDKDAGDSPQFGPLVNATAQGFTIKEVSADKAYLSHNNLELVESLGATPFVQFKKNSIDNDGAWGRMYHYFQFRQEEFQAHYHKRSNVESTFSAIKRKFGDSVRSRTDVSMVNEVLAKILAYNVVVNIHEQAELGIESVFWPEKSAAMVCLPFGGTRI